MQGKQQIAGKNLALGGTVYVSIRQRADQSVGFSAGARDITQVVFWQTKSTETAKISAAAKRGVSGCPALRWEGLRRGTGQGSGLPGRMRAGRSRAQIQPGKAEMWNGSGDGEAGRYSCACGCSAHSAAESAKDSVWFFTISGLAARLFATVRKTEGCSVDIIIKG